MSKATNEEILLANLKFTAQKHHDICSMIEAKNAKIIDMQTDLQQTQKTLAEVRADRDKLLLAQTNGRELIVQLKEEISDVSCAWDEAKSELQQVQATLADDQSSWKNVTKDNIKIREERAELLQAQDNHRKFISRLNEEISDVSNELQQVQATLAEVTAERDAARKSEAQTHARVERVNHKNNILRDKISSIEGLLQ